MSRYVTSDIVDDADQVPIRSAATVMVLRDRPELEVLMVRRTTRMAFAAGAWVFPGGRVDPDERPSHPTTVDGLTDAEAERLLGDDSGAGIAWWLAAIRETAEEAGLLLACDGCDATQVAAVRDRSRAASPDFTAAVHDHGLTLDLTQLHDVARFTTPVGPPRRFDTRFFVTRAPERQDVDLDRSEIAEHRWMRPADAIDLWARDEFSMMAVTHRMLSCLSRYPTSGAVIEHAASRPAPARVRVNDPDGAYEVLLPGEPGYEGADLEVEHGWVRLHGC